MFDLDPGVHFDEIEPPVLVEELDGPDPDIAELAHGRGHDLADLAALLRVEDRGRAFLPNLLVAPLQRAVALAEMNGVAATVAEHLDLDVPRLFEVFLKI